LFVAVESDILKVVSKLSTHGGKEQVMVDLKSRFEAAAKIAQSLPKRPSNETLLQLYAYYKQATVGDVSGKRPGFTDVVGRAKYDAWAGHKGMSSAEAMQAYIDLVETLKTIS
jgi:acyl-CoA-binding protein